MKIILSVALAALLFVGCGEEKSKPVEAVVEPVKAPTTAVATAHKIDAVIESASKTVDEVSQSVKEVSDATVAKSKEIVTKTKEVAAEVSTQVQASATAVSQKVDEVMADNSAAGKEAYASCGACHGKEAQKAALGKSQVIKGWSAAKVESALNGYIDGSYGGPMKAIMKGQASRLSEAEIKAVSEYISGL